MFDFFFCFISCEFCKKKREKRCWYSGTWRFFWPWADPALLLDTSLKLQTVSQPNPDGFWSEVTAAPGIVVFHNVWFMHNVNTVWCDEAFPSCVVLWLLDKTVRQILDLWCLRVGDTRVWKHSVSFFCLWIKKKKKFSVSATRPSTHTHTNLCDDWETCRPWSNSLHSV